MTDVAAPVPQRALIVIPSTGEYDGESVRSVWPDNSVRPVV